MDHTTLTRDPDEIGAELSADLSRALLPLLTLAAIATEPSYGYAIAVSLRNRGIGAVSGASLYPVLSRHEAAGYVTTQWRPGVNGPGRKYFMITPLGQLALGEMRAEADRIAATVAKLTTQIGDTP